MAETDLISRQAAIDAIHEDILLKPHNDSWFRENHEFVTVGYVERTLLAVPPAQPERMTNRQWIDFLSAQFDISRTSAKEMLHGMMQWKKADNSKKLFNGRIRTHVVRKV